MGLDLLPDELQLSLAQQWPCREVQIRSLSAFLNPSRPSPPTLVLYGPQATGKSGILRDYLAASRRTHAVVTCAECVTGRQLLERTIGAVREALVMESEEANDNGQNGGAGVGEGGEGSEFGAATRACESLAMLVVQLQNLLEKRRAGRENEKFVLAFDGVDVVNEAPPTLLPALGRFGEVIPDLTTILILQHPSPRFLHKAGVPQIHFHPYTREQSLHIVSRNPLDIFLTPPSANANNAHNANDPAQDYDDEVHKEDKEWLWPRFCTAVWDSLGQGAARDLVAFRDVCERLWRPFLVPVIKGDFGTRDFSRLMVAQRRLFQDEAVLLDSIMVEPSPLLMEQGVGSAGAAPPAATGDVSAAVMTRKKRSSLELPYYTRWIIIAAYLASYNPARTDTTFFMKNSERKNRKRRGGGAAGSASGRATGSSSKLKTPRHLLPPSTFTLDRLLAILHAILPHDFRPNVDFYTQIAALSGFRLLVRSGGGPGRGDLLEPAAKWKVGPAVTWDYVNGLARDLDFGLRDYAAE